MAQCRPGLTNNLKFFMADIASEGLLLEFEYIVFNLVPQDFRATIANKPGRPGRLRSRPCR